MSLYFLVNNLHFAFGMIGAIVLIMAAWLSYDAYRLGKDNSVLLRFIGFAIFSLWQIIYALNSTNDLLLYFGFVLFVAGLICIILSFLKTKQLAVNAVVIIPAFTLWSHTLYLFSTILLFIITYLSWRQSKKEYNQTWIPFSISFLLFGIASFFNIFLQGGNEINFTSILARLITLSGFIALTVWVWQYMRLRINESFVMISVGVTFFIATIITLAFSTILINRIAAETANNLMTDAKVLDFSLTRLKEEALAKSDLISRDQDIIAAVDKNNTTSLEQISEKLLEQYNLGFLTIADTTGDVLVRAHALSRRGDTLIGERAFEEAMAKNNFVTIESDEIDGFSIRAGSPIIKNNKVIGVVLSGFQLDNAFADNQKKLTGLEMFIYRSDVSVAGTFFGADGRTRLIGETLTDNTIRKEVLNLGKTLALATKIYDVSFHASYLPITNSDEKVIGMISVAKPQQDIVNIANATNRLTLVTVLLIILLLLTPIYKISKGFSREI